MYAEPPLSSFSCELSQEDALPPRVPRSLKTNQSACQTPASVSPPPHQRTCSPHRISIQHPHHHDPCLRQEDGTVHSGYCTRTRGVGERLAAGLLKSTMPCYFRLLLLLFSVILIVECRTQKSRKRRWSASAEPHKPGT